ncbi:hypothetical protein OG762_26965 [Streptomyces sp. NBC_01136]|uniref:hypothetical protein n=1 Tax=unclassified Streptomyces TaxID=2593676 RepID=UPI00324730F5|nr:hypothetical protein OG762_26965 [Streptomyces sp. NBC_01136]
MRVERVPALVGPSAVRAGLMALPVVSLRLLSPVPPLVIAPRRRSRADWAAFGAFSAVLVAWVMQLTPETTHVLEFADDRLLILASMAGAAVHAWTVWPRRVGH